MKKLLTLLLVLALMAPLNALAGNSTGPALLEVTVDRAIPVNLNAPAASVFIANPEVADVQLLSPTSVMVFGKRTGQTTLMASDINGHTLLHRTVMVAQDLTDLRLALDAAIPGNKIKIESVPKGIVLTGEVKDASVVEDARKIALRYLPADGDIINRIAVSHGNQIQIRVRFAEVSRDVDKRFGINWETIGNIGGFAFGIASGETVLGGVNLLDRYRPIVGTNTTDITSLSYSNGNWDVNGLIDALAEDGFVTILAEPSLTAMSGETASFLAGGEFPIPVPQSADTITIMFKQYGISLAFTPTIVGENRINLHVRPEVSQITDTGSITLNSITIPALTTRRAETTIELGSGQSFAIAGLLNSNQQQSVSKYPFLGDLPILGTLFRSSRFQNSQSELVIIITPYLVKPASSGQGLSLPTDGYSAPSDYDRIIGHRVSGSSPDARTISGAPTAVSLDPVEAVPPQAAPVEPVSEELVKDKLPAPVAVNPPEPVVSQAPVPSQASVVSVPAKEPPAKVKQSYRDGLSGPGGFVLE